MKTTWHDIRFGLRQLRKSPGFTAVAVVSLALGIGASTAIFSLVNAVLLPSLPVPNPHELRVLQWTGTEPRIRNFHGPATSDAAKRWTGGAVPYPLLSSLRQDCNSLADIFGYRPLYDITARAQREAFIACGAIVSDNFFSALGVEPLFGRVLSSGDKQANVVPETVITHSWWQQHFGRDPNVLGQSIMLNGHSFTIVGVLPREFAGVRPTVETTFYVSMSAQPQLVPSLPLTSPDHWWVQLMARLRPGANDAQFQAAADVVFAREAASIMQNPKVLVEDGRGGLDYDSKYYRKPLLLLLGIVGVVLLVVCGNIAGLSLARGAARVHEFAVRAAIGAGRWRLIRQSLTESMLLVLLGTGVGILLASWAKTAISRLFTGSAGGLHCDTSLDLTVLGFTLATALATALLSGLMPALRISRIDSFAELKDRSALGLPHLRMGRLLVFAQVALSMPLLVGAGLYVRTLVNLTHVDPGFATENILLFRLDARNAGYQDARTAVLYDDVQRSLAAIPGVRSVALTWPALLGGRMAGGAFILPDHSLEGEFKGRAQWLTMSETFFATMDIPVRLGRALRAADTEGAPKVVVVNETFMRKYLPDENPIGQMLRARGADWQIVGVCRDAKYTDIKTEAPPIVYFSFRQDPTASAFFALRTFLPPLAVVTAARKAVASIDSNVPLSRISTQNQMRDKNISQERLFTFFGGALASLALLLSCIGLYGLMAYNVTRRTNEIGVRKTLGATGHHIAGPILREALVMSGSGVLVGGLIALAVTRLIRNHLYGVTPNDPVTMVVSAFLLLAVTALAAWIPARRAARIDPMEALRYE